MCGPPVPSNLIQIVTLEIAAADDSWHVLASGAESGHRRVSTSLQDVAYKLNADGHKTRLSVSVYQNGVVTSATGERCMAVDPAGKSANKAASDPVNEHLGKTVESLIAKTLGVESL